MLSILDTYINSKSPKYRKAVLSVIVSLVSIYKYIYLDYSSLNMRNIVLNEMFNKVEKCIFDEDKTVRITANNLLNIIFSFYTEDKLNILITKYEKLFKKSKSLV